VFKAILREDLESALSLTDWNQIHAIHDVNKVLRFLVDGIVAALYIVAPEKVITVRKGATSTSRLKPLRSSGTAIPPLERPTRSSATLPPTW
jgi:hypothetical protein